MSNLEKFEIKEILNNYSIGNYKNHKLLFTAAKNVYKLTTSKGVFIVKVYGKEKIRSIKSQTTLLKYLNSKKVSVPKIISTKSGDDLLTYKEKYIEIQEFVSGKKVLYVNKSLAADMGRKLGILSKALISYNHEVIGSDNNPQIIPPWKINSLLDINLKTETNELNQNIYNLNKDKLRKSIIHGDICEGNFLVKNNKISKIIDWEGSHKDYLVHEIAVPLAHNFTTKRSAKRDLIKIFLKEYQKYVKLNEEEKKALYFFIKHRGLGSCSWSIEQSFKHEDKKKMFMRWAEHCLKRYKSFSKISLKEFIELAK